MIERLENIEKRYLELQEEIMKPEVLSDIKKTLALTKEQAALKDAYEGYQEYKKILEGINDAKELVKLLHGMLAHVNLIPINKIDDGKYTKSTNENIRSWAWRIC